MTRWPPAPFGSMPSKSPNGFEQALGEEQWSFIDSCPAEWSHLPIPNGPITVGIDGGYVRAQPKQGWFEVIAGKSLLAFRRGEESEQPDSSKCFAFVQTYDQKPKRRPFEVLQSQGHQLNQRITCLSDGGVPPQNQTLSIFGDARTERVIRTVTPVAPLPWGRGRGGR